MTVLLICFMIVIIAYKLLQHTFEDDIPCRIFCSIGIGIIGLVIILFTSLCISVHIVQSFDSQFRDVDRDVVQARIIAQAKRMSQAERLYVLQETAKAKNLTNLIQKVKSDPKMLQLYHSAFLYIQSASAVDLATIQHPDVLLTSQVSCKRMDYIYDVCKASIMKGIE